jgi:serine/threonine protein kinase
MRHDSGIPRSTPKWPRFLWHHRVHLHRRERLVFLRLLFAPLYERDEVETAIRTTCAAVGVRSYVAYELFGAHDSLLRVWLPADVEREAFQEAIVKRLGRAGLELAEPFEVDYVARHWAFWRDGRSVEPTASALHNLRDEEVAEVEEQFPDIRTALRDRLREHHLLVPFGGWDSTIDPERPGIKFAIVIGSDPDVELSPDDLLAFEETVTGVLDQATSVEQLSLYKGSGIGHLLVLGRVDYDKFHAIHAQIIARVNAAAIRERFHACTSTHISGQRGYHVAEEALSRAGATPSALVRRVPAPLGEAVEPSRDLAPGTVFYNRFEIVEPLGKGGFATVYRAFDNFEQVDRALKVFHSPNPEAARRELDALHRAREHPNIVKLYWAGQAGDQYFLVFEFVDGEPLHRVTGLEPLQVVDIALQVLDGLVAVHPNDARIDHLRGKASLSEDELAEYHELLERGLIHRDIKPENIMLDTRGVVRLVDFNIASPARRRKTTRSGTPPYQAPDAGMDIWEPSDDLFACGVVLYELLTEGKHPWPNSQPLANVPPIDPRTWRPRLPGSLCDVVVRACAPLRADRYATARELQMDLLRERETLELVEQAHESQQNRLGRLVKKRRTDRGISQEDLASDVGVPVEEIARLERGESIASDDHAAKIARRLEIQLREGPRFDSAT